MGMIGCYFQADASTLNKIVQEGCSAVCYDPANEPLLLEIDKAWHMIHYTLTGTVWETSPDDILSQLVLGGEIYIEEDMGYGPPRRLSPTTVRRLSEALRSWDRKTFRAHFNVKKMAADEVYPVLADEDEENAFEYTWEYFELLTAFFQDAGKKGCSVLVFIA